MINAAAFVNRHLTVKVRSGSEWQCLCPYHEDTQPSFSVNVRKGLFVCYACDAKGTIQQLADYLQTGTTVQRDTPTIASVQSEIEALRNPRKAKVKKVIPPEWIDAWRMDGTYRTMWAMRGIESDEVLDLFCLGYDLLKQSLVIPIHDPVTGEATSKIDRYMQPKKDSPKYKYERGFKISENLYGAWQARTYSPVSRIPKLALTEGSIDTLSLWEVGIPSVALLGARISTRQVKLLQQIDPVEVVLMLDKDTAGRNASLQVANATKSLDFLLTAPTEWPKGVKDPADLERSSRIAAFDSAQRFNWLDK